MQISYIFTNGPQNCVVSAVCSLPVYVALTQLLQDFFEAELIIYMPLRDKPQQVRWHVHPLFSPHLQHSSQPLHPPAPWSHRTWTWLLSSSYPWLGLGIGDTVSIIFKDVKTLSMKVPEWSHSPLQTQSLLLQWHIQQTLTPQSWRMKTFLQIFLPQGECWHVWSLHPCTACGFGPLPSERRMSKLVTCL